MSLNDITNPTRRGFMRNAFAAAVTPVLPKGALAGIGEIAEALPDLSRYALSSIPKELIKYFGWKIPLKESLAPRRSFHTEDYGLSNWSIIGGLDIEEDDPWDLFFMKDLLKASVIDTDSIPNLPDGSPLLCGHILRSENHDLLDDWATDDYHKDGSIEKAWQRFQELGFVQDQSENFYNLPVKAIYQQIQKLADVSLEKMINFGMTIPNGRRIFFGQIREMPEKHLSNLIKRFPEHADFFINADEFWERNKHFYERSNVHREYPPGHFHMEKHGMGKYTLHTPEIR